MVRGSPRSLPQLSLSLSEQLMIRAAAVSWLGRERKNAAPLGGHEEREAGEAFEAGEEREDASAAIGAASPGFASSAKIPETPLRSTLPLRFRWKTLGSA